MKKILLFFVLIIFTIPVYSNPVVPIHTSFNLGIFSTFGFTIGLTVALIIGGALAVWWQVALIGAAVGWGLHGLASYHV